MRTESDQVVLVGDQAAYDRHRVPGAHATALPQIHQQRPRMVHLRLLRLRIIYSFSSHIHKQETMFGGQQKHRKIILISTSCHMQGVQKFQTNRLYILIMIWSLPDTGVWRSYHS